MLELLLRSFIKSRKRLSFIPISLFASYDFTTHCKPHQIIIWKKNNTNSYRENAKEIKKTNTRNSIKN